MATCSASGRGYSLYGARPANFHCPDCGKRLKVPKKVAAGDGFVAFAIRPHAPYAPPENAWPFPTWGAQPDKEDDPE